MPVNRKDFIRNVSLASACLCGFVSLATASKADNSLKMSNENPNALQLDWISILLSGMESNLKPEDARKILKPCSLAHYEDLKMDDILAPFKGRVNEFCNFLSDKWGWKVSFDEKSGVFMANENKEQCVCPMVNHSKQGTSSVICYCSEGFAEKMFSFIIGQPVRARVVSSIHRGDKNCVYEIRL